MVKLSIIYVYYNTPKEIVESLRSVQDAVGNLSYEVVILNNASPMRLPKLQTKKITVIQSSKNLGFGGGVNRAAKKAKGTFLAIVNPDTILKRNSLELLTKKLETDDSIGVIGPKMIDEKGTLLRSISSKPSPLTLLFAMSFLNKLFPNNPFSKKYYLDELYKNKAVNVDVVGGACMVLRRKVFEKIGGFDERFFMYFEESDLCIRIKSLGLSVMYFPKAIIIHLVGKSLTNKDVIERFFVKSRFRFLKKYHPLYQALATEAFLRLTTLTGILLLLTLSLSAFLNLYKIHETMLFIGDAGRDYIAARNFVITGHVPLVGIPSSVIWLHQGPLSIYLIALAFVIGKFNPVAPAILYGLIGIGATGLMYILGKSYFNKTVGLLAAFFYATSPLVIVNARMPYHTSSIPLFTIISFLLLKKVIDGNKRFLFLLFLSFGLLMQVELSNAIFVLLFVLCFIIYKVRFRVKDLLTSLFGFLIGVLPFILYDITHRFVYSVGFPLWIVNRLRLFFGVGVAKATSLNIGSAIDTITQQITGVVFAENRYIAFLLIALVAGILILKRKQFKRHKGYTVALLWLAVPILGFLLHAAPGTAYFAALFPVLCLWIGYVFFELYLRNKIFIYLFCIVSLINIFSVIKNEYYVTNLNRRHTLPPYNYSLGMSLSVAQDVANFIIKDSNGNDVMVIPGGFIANFPTSVDTYKYLLLYHGIKINLKGKKYLIYENKNQIPSKQAVIYNNRLIYVTTQ